MDDTVNAADFIKAFEKKENEEKEEEKHKSLTPFDFIKSISNTKEDLLRKNSENVKNYNAFIINRGFGYFPDTVLIANEMNMYPNIPAECHYQYYMNSVRKGKRFSKWHKPEKDKDLELIQKIYNVRIEIAKQYRNLISDEDMKKLHDLSDTGDVTTKKKRK